MSTLESIIPAEARSSWTGRLLDGWARSQVCARLEQLQTVRLRIESADGVRLFGSSEASTTITLRVHAPEFWSHVAFGGTVGAGGAYINGLWSCDDLVGLIRLLCREESVMMDLDGGLVWLRQPLRRLGYWLRRNTRDGSRRNIRAHYDIGNDLFAGMLGSAMAYSANIYAQADDSLDQAELAKFAVLARRLQLRPGMRVLDLGCGWGGLSCYLAAECDVEVTAVTISQAQYDGARARIDAAGLGDRIDLQLCDYRDLDGQWDRIVSVEMIEAVGHDFYPTFFQQCRQLLADDGLMVMQAITIADRHYERARSEVDFIKRYIFPGSCIPSVSALSTAAAKTSDFEIVRVADYSAHYARTLDAWWQRCLDLREQLPHYDERFWRMWEFYLRYCEGGFAERSIGLKHLVWAANGWRDESTVRLGYDQP